jgi:argininosuccinate lyase
VRAASAGLVRTMTVMVDELARQATDGFTLATEVADWLARRGVPFSEAHEITGRLVRRCEDLGIGLEDLSEAELAAVDARLDPSIRSCLTAEAAVATRNGYGGTAPERVIEQLARLRLLFVSQSEWAMHYNGPRT